MTRLLSIVLTLVASLLVSGDARSESITAKDALELVDSCPQQASELAEEKRRDAIQHYNRGAVFYEQGDYDSSVDEFVAAYCDAPHPQMFFNIGQSFERLLDFETAIAYFQRFLDESAPGATNLERARVRVRVLKRLPARVRVASVPAGAKVSIRRELGLVASGKANDSEAILVAGGKYSLEVSTPGYETVTQEVEFAIGQPYSYYFQLERKKGALRVQVEPSSARIFVDNRLVGLGSYSETVDIGRYEVRVEASRREPVTRQVVVTTGRTSDESIRLPEPEATGRWELVTFGGFFGLLSGSAATSNIDIGSLTGSLLIGAGLSAGVVGGVVAIPKDIPISRSSFIITSGLVGALELGFGSSLILCDTTSDSSDCNGNAIFGASVVGLFGGVIFGAVAASRFNLDAGDAAILNSGMIWGTTVGSLFYASFDQNPDLAAPLLLAGLNLGLVSSITLGARVDLSRTRVALIDLSGLGGLIVGFAAAQAIGARDERVAHSALVGVAVGLIGGTLLTRGVDDNEFDAVPTPAAASVRDVSGARTTTIGASLRF